MPTELSYGYIPNSTKADRGYLTLSAFTSTYRGGNKVPYHTNDGCLLWDPVVANPTAVWHHPLVGTYVIDLTTTRIRHARKCERCEKYDSGWKALTKAEINRRWRENRAVKAGRAYVPRMSGAPSQQVHEGKVPSNRKEAIGTH